VGRAHLSGVLLAFVGKGGFAVCLYETSRLTLLIMSVVDSQTSPEYWILRDHHALQLLLHSAA
jgi:hypothetical protein